MSGKSQSYVEFPFTTAAALADSLRGDGLKVSVEVARPTGVKPNWREAVWAALVTYANTDLIKGKRAGPHVIALMKALGYDLYRAGDDVERGAADDPGIERRAISDATAAQDQVRLILTWVAQPGQNQTRDANAFKVILEHLEHVKPKLELIGGRDVLRQFKFGDFVDPVVHFVHDHMRQSGPRTARLPETSPIRICEVSECGRFFIHEHKNTRCPKHRDTPRIWRSTEENALYNYIGRNLDPQKTNLGQIKQRIAWLRKRPRSYENRQRLIALRWIRKNRKAGRKGPPQFYFDALRKAAATAPSA